MRTQRLALGAAAAPATRIVLLPGAYHALGEFIAAGFDQALRERELAVELILAAPELAHLNDRSWLSQLRTEVIAPARARGGGELWLGGISLGGYMALRFAAEGADELDGLCLLAPYLGSRIVAAEIAAHGNLASWEPGALADDDDDRRIWRLVQRLPTMLAAPRVFLGYGREDRFADTQRLLSGALPAACTSVIPGGHDWPVWRALWDRFLDALAGRANPHR
jgi:pimeloyl-ACP methyl ester carboxylesterase